MRTALLAMKRRQVTVADAAAATGLPLAHAEQALLELVSHYPARLVVERDGKISFDFRSLDKPRKGGAFVRWLRRARDRVQRMFGPALAFFTVVTVPLLLLILSCNLFAVAVLAHAQPWWIAAPVYVLLFPALFVVFASGFLGTVIYSFFPLLTIVMFAVAVGPPLMALFMPELDWWARLLIFAILAVVCGGIGFSLTPMLASMVKDMYADMAKPDGVSSVKSLWSNVRGFLFGPPRSRSDALADERRLTALIRERKGVIADRDLMALFGWNKWQAASECARIVADYGGELLIDDAGTVVYDFSVLLETRERRTQGDTTPAWQNEPPPPAFFGCERGLAFFVLYCAAVGVAGLALHPELRAIPTAEIYRGEVSGWLEGLGIYPYGLLACLVLRTPAWLVRRFSADRRHRELALLRRAIEDGRVEHEGLSRRDRIALVSFGGELDTTALDRPASVFPELEREERATTRRRTR